MESSMRVSHELSWSAVTSSQGRVRIAIDQSGRRFLFLGQKDPAIEHQCLVSLSGYEQLTPEVCLQAAPLAGILAALEFANAEFGAAALLVGQGFTADLWLRALKWQGCLPLHRETSMSLESQELSAATFLKKLERPVLAVETSGIGRAVESLVRLLRRGDRLLLAGDRESEVTLYAYRDVHKKGITLLGVDPSFENVFRNNCLRAKMVDRALRLIARDYSGSASYL